MPDRLLAQAITDNGGSRDEEFNILKVAILLAPQVAFKEVGNNKELSTLSKVEVIGEILTFNKPVIKAIIPDPGTVNDGGSPFKKFLGNRIVAANHINTITKLIREAFLTGFIKVDTDRFAIQDDILKYLDRIWVLEAL